MDYWKKHFNQNYEKYPENPKKQLDMTVNGNEVDEKQVLLRAESIKNNLKLDKNDIILDLCCGNGVITRIISNYVSYVYAIDFSENLIKYARENFSSFNIQYIIGDASRMDLSQYKANKINIYSCIQYLSADDLNNLLENLSVVDSDLIYISNIPDENKIFDYYNTPEKNEYYYSCLMKGIPNNIGTWYNKRELIKNFESHGFECKILDINPELNTSYYRFDVLLKRSK